MNLVQLLVRAARTCPASPALFLGSHCLMDYAALASRAGRLAGFLRESVGLSPGDRVALCMTNVPEYLEALYGIWWAGLVAVPVNAKLHPREVGYILENSRASAMFVSDDTSAGVNACASPTPCLRSVICAGKSADYQRALSRDPMPPAFRMPDELAWLFYTSGTTGQPKGVMLSHRNLYAMLAGYFADVNQTSRLDAAVYAAPMSHGAGMYNFPHVLKAARHVVPESGGFDPDELIDLSRSLGNLCLFAAPTMVQRLVERVKTRSADSSGFKTIVYGGGPMYVENIKEALAVMGNRFVQIYGQGESPMTISVLSREQLGDCRNPAWEQRIASVGIAQSVVEVQVVDAQGQPVPDGETGEITVRGEPVMAGYWNDPAASASAIRDGWLWTGDMGAMDADGFLTLKDRSKDLIISGGSNIYPREIEEVLLEHPGVREVSVVGKIDNEWGEVVVAFVVADGVAADELDRLCLDRIARFKRPKEYRFVESLPKNNYGKVLKTALRGLL